MTPQSDKITISGSFRSDGGQFDTRDWCPSRATTLSMTDIDVENFLLITGGWAGQTSSMSILDVLYLQENRRFRQLGDRYTMFHHR
jgi:hypothetical protein